MWTYRTDIRGTYTSFDHVPAPAAFLPPPRTRGPNNNKCSEHPKFNAGNSKLSSIISTFPRGSEGYEESSYEILYVHPTTTCRAASFNGDTASYVPSHMVIPQGQWWYRFFVSSAFSYWAGGLESLPSNRCAWTTGRFYRTTPGKTSSSRSQLEVSPGPIWHCVRDWKHCCLSSSSRFWIWE